MGTGLWLVSWAIARRMKERRLLLVRHWNKTTWTTFQPKGDSGSLVLEGPGIKQGSPSSVQNLGRSTILFRPSTPCPPFALIHLLPIKAALKAQHRKCPLWSGVPCDRLFFQNRDFYDETKCTQSTSFTPRKMLHCD